MYRIANVSSSFGKIAALALALVALAAMPASAAPNCKRVHAHLFIEAEAVPTCGSAIGLCATATLYGSLEATTDFIGTWSDKTVDTDITGVAVLTGDNTFHTSSGDFSTKDAIVLSGVNGTFAEVDTVIGGTGAWNKATGTLTATGTFVDGIGEGIIEGEICTP